jgi:acetolactate synthase-1/2/3 large subunit
MKYSDCIAQWLCRLGYTHCFFVGGGNIMHLVESLSRTMTCVAVIHEVAAGIAAEYFNETNPTHKALALVTAGPGLTNLVTAVAGAYMESRELLILGGQVKTSDLALGKVRQRGIQEIDGVSLLRSITVHSERVDTPMDYPEFERRVMKSKVGRQGPVFLEFPINVQGAPVDFKIPQTPPVPAELPQAGIRDVQGVIDHIRNAQRPIILVGGGVDRSVAAAVFGKWAGVPVATTWNGADRIPADHPAYAGRPNTWGQRRANLILQQADCVVALGTRLGLQQTGFNWQEFAPLGKVIQVDLDRSELEKGHPKLAMGICGDANDLLIRLADADLGDHSEWMTYVAHIRTTLPLIEPVNQTGDDYISPYQFVDELSRLCTKSDVIVPCSSGGAFTVMMQIFQHQLGQVIVTNKGMASMGYGLSGAIGAAFANPDKRTILVEGDGGFAQNLQEIGTAAINGLHLKMFIFDDSGYASIRMTQRNYFGGRYVGCDRDTGLGLPDWEILFQAWNIPVMRLGVGFESTSEFQQLFEQPGVAAFIVSVDPEQTYFPKITSRILETGAIVSNPLHLMTPDLEIEKMNSVGKFFT